MQSIIESETGRFRPADHNVTDRLEAARSRLEERFLAGGDVLCRALETIGDMIGAVDGVTSSLGEDTVEATVADLNQTGTHLLALPGQHGARLSELVALGGAGGALKGDVDTLLETLRYLRTFAVTVKITGAGTAAFASFADEMLDRIQSGRDQVEDFAGELRGMLETVRNAVALGRDVGVQVEGVVPDVTRDLSRDAERIGAYHVEVRAAAAALSDLSRQVQGKVARALSALQIGDMTRQRVEHVQAGLALLASEGDGMTPAGRNLVLVLLTAQMEDLLEAFHAGCTTITSCLGALAADAKEIVALGRRAGGGTGTSGEGVLRALEKSVGRARQVVGGIEAAGARAAAVSRESADTAARLTRSIDSIRAIRSEIQYMAINTSLRCSRMGEAGKPMNVVASELRVFTDQMETVSGRLLGGLARLSEVASAMTGDGEAPTSLGEGLDAALANITTAAARTGADLKDLSARGDRVAHSIGEGVSRLDFTRELGEVLEECAVALAEAAAAEAVMQVGEGDEAMAAALAERLFRTYTMAREREVHRLHFPQAAEAVVQPAAAEDDLDAVLF